MPKLILKQTSGACPEQYDVYHQGLCIGYLRLRHGYFRAEYCDIIVYSTNECKGDGVFTSEERDYYLTQACAAIWAAHQRQDREPLYAIED